MDLMMELIDASTPTATPAAKPTAAPSQASAAQPAQDDATRKDERTSDSSVESRKKEGHF